MPGDPAESALFRQRLKAEIVSASRASSHRPPLLKVGLHAPRPIDRATSQSMSSHCSGVHMYSHKRHAKGRSVSRSLPSRQPLVFPVQTCTCRNSLATPPRGLRSHLERQQSARMLLLAHVSFAPACRSGTTAGEDQQHIVGRHLDRLAENKSSGPTHMFKISNITHTPGWVALH